MAIVQDWDIKPRDEACHQCKTPFEDNQSCCSCLVFGEEGYARADFCEKCWEEHGKQQAVSLFSQWKGVFRKPPPEPEETLKKETAEELLRHMMEQEDPSKRNVMYILALMLERKRVLTEKDVQTRDDGVTIRVYEHRKTGETFLVPDPKLGFDQLEQVQQEVANLLGMGKKTKDDGQKPESNQMQTEESAVKDRADEDEEETVEAPGEEEDKFDDDDDDDEDESDDDGETESESDDDER